VPEKERQRVRTARLEDVPSTYLTPPRSISAVTKGDYGEWRGSADVSRRRVGGEAERREEGASARGERESSLKMIEKMKKTYLYQNSGAISAVDFKRYFNLDG